MLPTRREPRLLADSGGTEVDFVVYGNPGLQPFEAKLSAGSIPLTLCRCGPFARTVPNPNRQ